MINKEFIESIRLEGEEWRDVVGYEETYMVSSYGRIMSKCRRVRNRYSYKTVLPRLLNPHKRKGNGMNYSILEMKLWKGSSGKTFLLHRLIANAFLENPNNFEEIDHIDGDTSNNAVSNLRWCNHTTNVNNPITRQRNSLAKRGRLNTMKSKAVVQIKDNTLVKVFPSMSEAEREGFNHAKVSDCCAKKKPQYKGYRWMLLSDYETLVSMSKNSTESQIG